MMANILLLAATLLTVGVSTQDPPGDGICLRDFVTSSRGRVFVMVHQLHPISVKVIEHVKMEFCTGTDHGFYLQVWQKVRGTNYREYILVRDEYLNRTADGVILYTLSNPINLTDFDESVFEDLHIGLFVPYDRQTNGIIPIRGQHHRGNLVDRTVTPSTVRLKPNETHSWRDLGYPFYFMMTICESPTVSTCILPEACGVPGHALVRRRPVPFTGDVRAIIVDFCAKRASIEVSLLRRSKTRPGEYENFWSMNLDHNGASIKPLVINLAAPYPQVPDADTHLAIRNRLQPVLGKMPSIPVRSNFSEEDHSWVSLDSSQGIPANLDTLLLYPFFFRFTVCDKEDCIDSVESWVNASLLVKPPGGEDSGSQEAPGQGGVGQGPAGPPSVGGPGGPGGLPSSGPSGSNAGDQGGSGQPSAGPGSQGGPPGVAQTPGSSPGTPGGGPAGAPAPGAGPGTPGGGPAGAPAPGSSPGTPGGGPAGAPAPGSGPGTPGGGPAGAPAPGSGPGSPGGGPAGAPAPGSGPGTPGGGPAGVPAPGSSPGTPGGGPAGAPAPGSGPGTPGGGPAGAPAPGSSPGTPGGGPVGAPAPGSSPGSPGGPPVGPQTPGSGPGSGGPVGSQTPGDGFTGTAAPTTGSPVVGPGQDAGRSPGAGDAGRTPGSGQAGAGTGVNGSRAGGVEIGVTTTATVVTRPSGSQGTSTVMTVFELPPLPGLAGPVGLAGLSGLPGPEGATGPVGPPGGPGTSGVPGAAGLRGLKGDTGLLGLEGIQGPGGVVGPTGEDGLQGVLGEEGDRGAPGDPGPPGKALRPQTASASSSSGDQPCGCDGLINRRVVLGLVVWCVLLTLLVVILLTVAYRNVKAERDVIIVR